MALSHKQRVFIDAYLATFNATEAARQAKYKGNDATLASVGWENLRKPDIDEAIRKRLQESAMSADEVLKHLAEHARGDMGDFMHITENGPRLDLQPAALMGKTRLIRKVKTKTRTYRDHSLGDDDDNTVTEVDTEIELYNAQSALELIGKHHKLFTDGPTGSEKDPIHIKHIKEVRPSDDSTTE